MAIARSRRLIEQLPPRTLSTTGIGGGAWSPADLLGHLAAWEGFALDALHAWDRRERAPIDIALDARGLNGVNADALAEASSARRRPSAGGIRTDARGVGRGRPRGSRGSVGQAPVHARTPARPAPRVDPRRARRSVPSCRRPPARPAGVRVGARAPLVGCRCTTIAHTNRREARTWTPTFSAPRQPDLVAPGKGILAADESTGTIKKRFDSIGLESTEDNRRAYRDMLFTTPGLAEHVSGVILFDETIRQSATTAPPFPELLAVARHHPRHQGRHRREAAGDVPRRDGDRGARRAPRAAGRLPGARRAVRQVARHDLHRRRPAHRLRDPRERARDGALRRALPGGRHRPDRRAGDPDGRRPLDRRVRGRHRPDARRAVRAARRAIASIWPARSSRSTWCCRAPTPRRRPDPTRWRRPPSASCATTCPPTSPASSSSRVASPTSTPRSTSTR